MDIDELIRHTGRAVSRPPPPAWTAADRVRGGWRGGGRIAACARDGWWEDPTPRPVPGA